MRILFLLLALLAGCSGAPATEWTTVRTGDLVLGVDVTGTLRSADTVLIGPPAIENFWNFNVTYLAPEGSDVVEGDKVLGFDVQELRQRLAQKTNEADSWAKELEKKLTSTTMARRDEELRIAEAEAAVRRATMAASGSPDLTASVELQASRLDLQLAEAALEAELSKVSAATRRDAAEIETVERTLSRARERVSELERDIERMMVKAPRPGAVLYAGGGRDREKVKIGDRLWRGRKPLEIVALDDIHADGEVDEMDGSRIAVGQPVKLRLDANPDVELTGEVASVLKSVKRRSREDPRKVVRVTVTLTPNDAVQLRPGMRFRGTIETERIAQTLLVEADAVFLGPEGARAWRQTGRGAEPVTVELGARNGTDVQLVKGLAEGDRVSRSELGDDG
ncbi:MAG: HlyD family efflux transporter periplasmic adaptor subunit [Deltaproteobacteria bacterium]|nr:HlyD family efflux transporter periplasmic adaptor subunit [Deltaproteobacteria bacterium]